jgi:hypothetical protein
MVNDVVLWFTFLTFIQIVPHTYLTRSCAWGVSICKCIKYLSKIQHQSPKPGPTKINYMDQTIP